VVRTVDHGGSDSVEPMTRSSIARLLCTAAFLTALLVPAGALGLGVYGLDGKTQHGSDVSLTLDSSNLVPHGFSVRVLLHCGNGHLLAAHVQAAGFNWSHYESVHNSLGTHYVSYDAHGSDGAFLLSTALDVVAKTSHHVTAKGTFNVSYVHNGLYCDSGNVSLEAHTPS